MMWRQRIGDARQLGPEPRRIESQSGHFSQTPARLGSRAPRGNRLRKRSIIEIGAWFARVLEFESCGEALGTRDQIGIVGATFGLLEEGTEFVVPGKQFLDARSQSLHGREILQIAAMPVPHRVNPAAVLLCQCRDRKSTRLN